MNVNIELLTRRLIEKSRGLHTNSDQQANSAEFKPPEFDLTESVA
jgi:hypothetical protein